MSVLFLKILNMSISASWLILAIILFRVLLKKTPKWINCMLWALVAVRLLCPIVFESSMSLVPNPEPVPLEIFMAEPPETHTNTFIDSVVNPNLPDVPSAVLDTTVDMMQTKSVHATLIWMSGVAAMLAYAAISYIRVRRKVKASLRLRDRIWICDDIQTPFILGCFNPKVYIPSGTDETQIPHIIAHENAHLKRRDHLWKPLGYLILAIHWFNPLVWIAYILLCRDIELACDEKVIRYLTQSESISYSEALLSCSVNRRTVMVCPLAFGEVGVKERVKRVLNYKKPAFWIVVVALLSCIVVAVCFLTNPKQENAYNEACTVREWFNYTDDPTTMEDELSIELPEYPGITFHWSPGSVYADTGSETIELYTGMPIWNVFFCDLTGDGKPELCSTISLGSGIIDNRIIIYDYAGGSSYELEDRGEFDYSLRMENDRIYVDKKIYNSDELVETGYLSFASGVIEIVKSDSTISTFGGVDEPQRTDITVETELDTEIDKAIHDHYASDKPNGLFHVESYAVLANEAKSGTPPIGDSDHMEEEVTVYLLVFHEKYSTYGGTLESVGGSYIPTAITFSIDESDEYTLKEYWEPRDGSDYTKDIRAKFPGASAEDAFNVQAYIEDLQTQNYNKALAYLDSIGGLDLRIAELLDIIQSSPAASSNPGDYIDAHENEYQELLDYGQYTLRYCFSEFLSGEQTDLRGQIMSILLDDIAPEAQLKLYAENGQDYFDEWKAAAIRASEQHNMEWIEKNQPAIFLLLQMINE